MSTSTRTWGNRRWQGIALAGALVLAACGGDDESSVAQSGDQGSTVTEPPAAVVELQAVCSEADGPTYVSYASESDETVVLDGDANVLLDADGAPHDGEMPSVFAPGDQEMVVAWLAPGWTWTVGTGDDARSVVADGSAPQCDEPPGAEGDVRSGEVEASVEVERDADGAVTSAAVTIDYVGLGESRCPAGPVEWTPRPVEVGLGFGSEVADDALVELGFDTRPTPVVIEIDDPTAPRPDAGVGNPPGWEHILFAIEATDVCVDPDGNEHRAWATSPDVLYAGFSELEACFGLVDDDYVEVDCPPPLPRTGDGIRIRLP